MNANKHHRILFEGKWAPLWNLMGLVCINSWLLAMFDKNWQTGFLWISSGGIAAIFGAIFHAHQRAKCFFGWFTINKFIATLSFLDISCQFALTGIVENQHMYISVLIATWLIFLGFGILDANSKICEGKKYMIRSGALNLKTAEWDNAIGIQLDDPQHTQKKISTARKLQLLSPLMPPLAFFISQNFSSRVEHLVISSSYYIVLLVFGYAFGPEFIMWLTISKWEKEIGKQITIKQD